MVVEALCRGSGCTAAAAGDILMAVLVVYDAGEGYPAVGDLIGPDLPWDDQRIYEVTGLVDDGKLSCAGALCIDTSKVYGKVRTDVTLGGRRQINRCYIRVEDESDGTQAEL